MKCNINYSSSVIIEFYSMNGTLLKVVFAEKVKCGKAEKRKRAIDLLGVKLSGS